MRTTARRVLHAFMTAITVTVSAASCSSGAGLIEASDAAAGADSASSKPDASRLDSSASAKDGASKDAEGGSVGPDTAVPPHEAGAHCGATTGNLCADGSTCSTANDCESGLCTAGICTAPPPTCMDGEKNGMETDVDCGGPVCAACATGKDCATATDCTSLVCTGGTCQAATDTDGVLNDSETDVDCGGGLLADGTANAASDGASVCAVGKRCLLPTDCAQGVCASPVSSGDAGASDASSEAAADGGTTALYCQPASPTDGVKNDSETDVDCGGGLLADGTANPSSDGAPSCGHGQGCLLGSDCSQGVCNANADMGGGPIDCPAGATCACQVPWDNDGVKNDSETDVDCGGGTALGSDGAPPCPPMQHCRVNADCQSSICGTNGLCSTPTATDKVKNDSETDVDCGGAVLASGATNPASDGAPPCADTLGCALDADCLSGFCSLLSHTCVDGQSCKGLATPAQIMDQTGTVNPDGTVTTAVDAAGDAIGTPDPNGVGQSAGLDTCGIGESTDLVTSQQHESCCKSLSIPGLASCSSTVPCPAGETCSSKTTTAGTCQLRMDKYEVTSGRIRQFLESLNYDVRDWALAQFDAHGNALTQAGTMLAAQIPTAATGINNGAGATTNALNFLPHSASVTEPLNAVLVTGALVLDTSGVQGCFTNDGAGGAATYWWDADTIDAIAGSPPRPFTQDYYDIKPMNCIPYYLAAAFCAWDGGRLPTEPEHKVVWGAATYPWGTTTPPFLYSGTPAAFTAKAVAAGLPITGYTVDWHDGGQAAGSQGDFYYYPSWVTNNPNEFVPDSLSNTLDLSVYIAAPGRFYADRTTLRSPSFGGSEGWQDLGADMIEWAQVSALTGAQTFCDESGIKAANETFNCGTNGVTRGTKLPEGDILGGSWEGHAVEETLEANWSFYRQYGKTGLRCVRPPEPAP